MKLFAWGIEINGLEILHAHPAIIGGPAHTIFYQDKKSVLKAVTEFPKPHGWRRFYKSADGKVYID